ncbi:hypothetical protein Daus18300_009574 [Diaporthe australafricana]|uniref:Uncharacterized protein n=1 Tax=Diaporthe australafricana TaxID=127596 RepID=A0ABR3WDR5_9PEZI
MSNIALFSVVRAINGGPSSITERLVWTPREFVKSLPAFLILMLYLTTIASEFTSTILLEDFRDVPLLVKPTERLVKTIMTQPDMLAPSANASLTSMVWESGPPSYPSFAEELLEPPLDGLQDTGDTGLIRRAFIPFAAFERENLHRYQGGAVIWESRVACIRPQLTGRVEYEGHENSWLPRLVGTASWLSDEAFSNFSCEQGATRCINKPFDCALPFHDNMTRMTSIMNKKPTSLCLFNRTDQQKSPGPYFSNIMMVFDTMTPYLGWLDFDVNDTTPSGRYIGDDIPESTPNGEWSSYKWNSVVKLGVTVCQSFMRLDLQNITASSANGTLEPRLNYDSNAKAWDTGEILKLVGAGNFTPSDRGILTITDSSKIPDEEFQTMFRGSSNFDYLSNFTTGLIMVHQHLSFMVTEVKAGVLTSLGAKNYTVYFCTQCPIGGNWTDPHYSISVLFESVLEKTGSAASAWSSMMFWLAQAEYYSGLPGVDFGANSTMVYSRPVSIPQMWLGIGIVAGVIITNMSIVASITWLYLRKTRFSMYGDVWHTIAQIISPDTRHLLERATSATDRQVEQSLKAAGSKNVDAGLYLLRSGRVAVLRSNAPFKHLETE